MGIDPHKLGGKLTGGCAADTQTPLAVFQQQEQGCQHHGGNSGTDQRMFCQHDLPAKGTKHHIRLHTCLGGIIKGFKGNELRIAEHQRNAAVEQGHKSHGDNLLSQLSHMASLAEHHQVDKKADNDTHDHAGQHAQVNRDPPPVQTFCHYIAAKGCDRSLGKIGRGGCPKNNGYRERRQRRHAYTQQRSANRRQKCGKHECAPPFSLCGES